MRAGVWSAADRGALFDAVPSAIVVIDRDRNIVDHNDAFEGVFGESRGRACHRVLQARAEPCPSCPADRTFEDRRQRVVEQTGRDRNGRPVHYLVQLTPMGDADGRPDFVAAVTTDLTPTRRLQREYQILFEKVPCFVAVINREYRVVKANERFRRTFGAPAGERCYRLFKQRAEPCEDCPVARSFEDGQAHTVRQLGVGRTGSPTHYVAFTAPLESETGEATHVIHMSLDVTEVHQLEARLTRSHALRRALLNSSLDSTVVFDRDERIQLVNPAAERLWGYAREDLLGRKAPRGMIPSGLRPVLAGRTSETLLHEAEVKARGGEAVPVRAAAVTLRMDGDSMGTAVIAHDLTEMKKLAREKLEVERLAAVGQTVAGLAHGIKNILTGLEGGMYVTSSGLERNDTHRIHQGWTMLERNMTRISSLAKNLLAFSRGDRPAPRWIRPGEIVADVVNLFRGSAQQHGIVLRAEVADDVETAFMDPEGLHSCLANLVSNAMDACLVSRNRDCSIDVRMMEKDGALVFEIADTGCGMDYEVKQKAFTSFFTTKGKGGTGIGLLITRKIVQQHGGFVTLVSTPGQGATFRLTFPRDRLPVPDSEENRHD